MIAGAGVLVLLGAGLFAAGIATGDTAFHWSTVAACAAAGVLLGAARVRTARAARRTAQPVPPRTAPPHSPAPDAAGPPAEVPPAPRSARAASSTGGDPPVEEVEVTDLLLVVDLDDEVLVVDGHPRYHVAGCPWPAARPTLPLPVLQARAEGFTPCARCAPDRTLAERERGRRGPRGRSG